MFNNPPFSRVKTLNDGGFALAQRGLVGDLEQLALASGAGAVLNVDLVPFSPAVESLSLLDSEVQKRAITGGDDYEILFAVPYKSADAFEAECREDVRHIGEIVEGEGVTVRDAEGAEIDLGSTSWSHFS